MLCPSNLWNISYVTPWPILAPKVLTESRKPGHWRRNKKTWEAGDAYDSSKDGKKAQQTLFEVCSWDVGIEVIDKNVRSGPFWTSNIAFGKRSATELGLRRGRCRSPSNTGNTRGRQRV